MSILEIVGSVVSIGIWFVVSVIISPVVADSFDKKKYVKFSLMMVVLYLLMVLAMLPLHGFELHRSAVAATWVLLGVFLFIWFGSSGRKEESRQTK